MRVWSNHDSHNYRASVHYELNTRCIMGKGWGLSRKKNQGLWGKCGLNVVDAGMRCYQASPPWSHLCIVIITAHYN